MRTFVDEFDVGNGRVGVISYLLLKLLNVGHLGQIDVEFKGLLFGRGLE